MASYVRHTSLHFAMTRFSQRPLKFFFLTLQNLLVWNALLLDPIFPKVFPKNENGLFLGELEIRFLGNRKSWICSPSSYYGRFEPLFMKIITRSFFPKSIKENITMSWGTDIYSEEGHLIYSPWLCQGCPLLHGDGLFSKQNIPVFTQVEDKKDPARKLR